MKKHSAFIFILLTLAFASFGQVKVACVGNSITYGYGLSNPSTQSYPSQLQQLLGNDYLIGNFGVSGRTLLKKGDKPYWNESKYTESKTFLPNKVIIMLGTNDAKLNTNWQPHQAEFKADFKALINSYRSLSTSPEIFICQLVPAYKEIWEISDTIINKEVNPMIKEIALSEGVHLIDMYSLMSNKANQFISDGIHPNANGAVTMAQYYSVFLKTPIDSISQTGNTLTAPEGIEYQWYLNNLPITKENGGQNRQLSPNGTDVYKVSVRNSQSNQDRHVSNAVNFKPQALLNDLIIDPIPFEFDPNQEEYELEIKTDSIKKIAVIPLYNSINITINENTIASNDTFHVSLAPLFLDPADSTIDIYISSSGDNMDAYEYIIHIKYAGKPDENNESSITNTYTKEALSHTVYPNPAEDKVHFLINDKTSKERFIKLYNSNGEYILGKKIIFINGVSEIDFSKSKLKQGIYHYQLEDQKEISKGSFLYRP